MLVLLMINGTAQTETNEGAIIELERYIVNADDEPGNFLLNMDEIALTQAVDLKGLLSNQSTLAVGGGSAVAEKIYVRGFEDTLLNVTIDGAQQSGELYHHQGRVQIEPEFIKTIKLDAGAGAATSGPGALTGALRIENKSAFDMLLPEQSTGAFLKGTYGLNGDDCVKAVISGYARIGQNTGIIATFAYEDAGDYEDGEGNLVEPTAATHERGYVKINGDFNYHKWSVGLEKIHDFGTYYERPNFINFTGSYILSDHELNRESVTLNYHFDSIEDWLSLNATVYATANDFENARITSGTTYGKGEFSSSGFDLRNTSEWEYNAITFGLDYRTDSVGSAQNATPPPYWGTTEQSASVLGIYLQDNWAIIENLKLSAGIRFDSYQHDVDAGVSAGAENSDTGLSPNVNMSWEVTEGLTLRTAYSQAFRGVTIREAFFSALYVHRGDLNSEKADNMEFGLAYEKDGFYARATIFKQTIKNFIDAEYSGVDAWGYWANVGDAEVEGYEAEIGKTFKQLDVGFGVWNAGNSLNGKPLTDGAMGLGRSIGRTWTAKIDYQVKEQALNFGVRARYVEGKENTIAEDAPDKPAFFIVDFHSVWRPFDSDTLTLGLSVNNALNEQYWDHATYSFNVRAGGNIGYPAKGREFVLSASLKF